MKKITILCTYLFIVQGCQMPYQPVTGSAIEHKCPEASRVGTWLLQRSSLCELPVEERRLKLDALSTAGQSGNKTRIERLLLASCQPDLTPGLLMEALNGLPDQHQWSPDEIAFIQSMKDMTRSYLILDNKNRELKLQLEKTIEGIRDIEADMDRFKQNGSSQ